MQNNIPLVLIVDSDGIARRRMRQVMRSEGYQTLEAASGADCLEMCIQFHPDLILLDYESAWLEGVPCCQKFPADNQALILMITYSSDADSIDQMFEMGAADYITKPIHWSLLQHRAKRLLQRFQSEQQLQQLKAELDHERQLCRSTEHQVEILDQLNQLKSDFLNMVTHGLRSPLSNMKLAIQMLTRLLTEATLQTEQSGTQNSSLTKSLTYVQILRDECEREITLINDSLDLQRLEAGKQPFRLEIIAVERWLTDLIQPFAERIQQRQLALEVHIAPDLPVLRSDQASLHRVLSELLHNACKYTPPHETIRLTVGVEAEQFQIRVENSGVEISAEELPRIFDKFYQIPGSDRWKQGGTGLGLALVKKLVEHLGGSIQVTSTDMQTSFIVSLPFS